MKMRVSEEKGVQTGVVADLNLAPKPTNAGQVNINNWIRFYSNPTWNSGSATTAVIRIINLNPALGGNDFGLDDISFGTLSTFIKGPQVVNSDVQNKCVNTPIDEISYQVGTGGTGPLITGLPPGVTTSFNGITLTINGSPTVPGIYNYKIKTQGSCNPDSAVGVIDVKPDATLSLNSGTQSLRHMDSARDIPGKSAHRHPNHRKHPKPEAASYRAIRRRSPEDRILTVVSRH